MVRAARYVYTALAWAFVAAIVIQVFLMASDAQSALGEAVYNRGRAEGYALDTEAGVAYALERLRR